MRSPAYPPQSIQTPNPATGRNTSPARPKPPHTMALVGITVATSISYLTFIGLLSYIFSIVMINIIGDDSLKTTISTHGYLAAYLFGAAITIVAFYSVMSLRRPLRLYFKRVSGRGLLTAIKYYGFAALPQSILILVFIILLGQEYVTPSPSQSELLLSSELVMYFAVLTIVAPILEEMICRGYLYAKLRQRHKFWPAALISGIVFTLLHVQYYLDPVALASVFLLSFFLARSFEKTRNLWIPILIHAFNNATVFILGYYL